MMYATHKAGGALFALVGFELLSRNNLLASDIAPMLQLVLMYPACSFGSTAPDLDHGWSSVKEHTPFNCLVHKILHLTKPAHRSWQTHCILVSGGFLALLFSLVYAMQELNWFALSSVSIALIRLLVIGLGLGIASHLVLDTFTMDGVWLIPGVKFRLVPHSAVFGTDTKYERIVRGILYFLVGIMLIWVLNPFGLQDVVLGLTGGGAT